MGEPSPVSKTRAGFLLETIGPLVTPQEHFRGRWAQGLRAAGTERFLTWLLPSQEFVRQLIVLVS